MGMLSKLFGTNTDSTYKTCLKIYAKAKRGKPGKSERNYLKFVLLTKPPYDYQTDAIINPLLDELNTVEDLANFVAKMNDPNSPLWESRERNLKFSPEVKKRNEDFFREFWN